VLSKAEVEKSMQEGMAVLEELPWFELDPALEGALPQEGEVRLPLTVEMPALTVRAGVSVRAQEATKEATPEGALAQVGSVVGGGSR
jgi:hypothetical protein